MCTFAKSKSIEEIRLAGALGKRRQATVSKRIIHHANGANGTAQIRTDVSDKKSGPLCLYTLMRQPWRPENL